MNRHANYFKIGAFVLAGFFLVAAALIYLGAGRMFRPRFYVETYVDGTVQGIDVGSAVKLRGVTIGRVSHIDFTFNTYNQPEGREDGRRDYVIVVLEVENQAFHGLTDNPDLDSYIKKAVDQGLRAMIQPQGITGLNFVELDYLPEGRRLPPLKIWWTPNNPYIPSALGTLTSMLDSVNRIMDTVNSLDVGDTLKELNGVMRNFNETLSRLQGDLDQMDLAKTGADLRKLIEEMHTKVAALPVEQLSADGLKLMQSVTAVANRAQALAGKIESSPVLDKKATGSIVSDLQSTADNFRALSETLRRRPSLILWGNPPNRSSDGPVRQR